MTKIKGIKADNFGKVRTHSTTWIWDILSILFNLFGTLSRLAAAKDVAKVVQDVAVTADGDVSETEGRLGTDRLDSGLVNLKGERLNSPFVRPQTRRWGDCANLVRRSQREGEPHLDLSNAVLLVEQIHHCDSLAWYYPHTCSRGMHVKRRSGVSAKRRDGVVRREEGFHLMGHKFTLRGATSAFYQRGPDSVTGDDCLQICHWAF